MVDCELAEKPRNRVVVAGQPFTLTCRLNNTNGQVTWRYLSLTATSPSDIYTEKSVRNTFKNKNITVVPSNGNFSLMFNSGAALSDAGTYTCQEDGTNNAASALITVLGLNITLMARVVQAYYA